MKAFDYKYLENFKETETQWKKLAEKGWYSFDWGFGECDFLYHDSGWVIFETDEPTEESAKTNYHWVKMRLPKREIRKAVFEEGSDFTKSVEHDTPESYWKVHKNGDMAIVIDELRVYGRDLLQI